MKSSLKAIANLIGDYSSEAVYALYAMSQVGKTTLLLQLAYEYSAVEKRNVLLYDTEGGLTQFVEAWDKKFKEKYSGAKTPIILRNRQWLKILEDYGKNAVYEVSGKGKYKLSLQKIDDGKIYSLIKSKDVGFLAIDSFTMPFKVFGTGNENYPARSQAQGWLLDSLLGIMDDHDCTIWTIHHASLNPAQPFAQEVMTGGSAVQYMCKVILNMRRLSEKTNYRKLMLARFFDRPPKNDFALLELTNDGYVDRTLEDYENARKR